MFGLQISKFQGHVKNGYYQGVDYSKIYDSDLKLICHLDPKTILFALKTFFYRSILYIVRARFTVL